MSPTYDALLLLSYGGPEGPDEVMPFLKSVTRGRRVPEKRLREVAGHYGLFDGVSPINAENRALLVALVNELNAQGMQMPVYWGNRHWHPLIPNTLRQMAQDGVRRALAFATSPYGSYHGCRAYREAIESARREVGDTLPGITVPRIDKLRLFYNHPGFIEPMADRLADGMAQIPLEFQATARIVFTAHSIPQAMARQCAYQQQLEETCRLVVDQMDSAWPWQLAYQSRSGRPAEPWLGPDLRDHLKHLADAAPGVYVVIVPVGFTCEHMEIVYDLDVEAARWCEELGLTMIRAATIGCHPRYVRMIGELIGERRDEKAPRLALGTLGPGADICPGDCCPG